MNRLSEGAIELNDNEVFNNCSYSCYANIADALNILKAYENTGLEPEQIKQLNDAFINSQKKLEKTFDELFKYKDLEEQGNFINLPCKVGDTVYAVNCNEIIESTVTEITLNEKGVRYIRLYSTDDRLADFKYDYFKKTAFLTREEAEKALKEREVK